MRIVALGCVAAAAVFIAMPAQAATLSECAAQWKAAKAAKQTEGKTYKEFSRACMGGAVVAQADAAKPDGKPDNSKDSNLRRQAGVNDIGSASGKKASTADSGKPAAKKTGKKSASPAAQRQRACGAEWKADKAAGKVEKGMTWPKYWSACSKRKKAESA
jgi:hypothetical protein